MVVFSRLGEGALGEQEGVVPPQRNRNPPSHTGKGEEGSGE